MLKFYLREMLPFSQRTTTYIWKNGIFFLEYMEEMKK